MERTTSPVWGVAAGTSPPGAGTAKAELEGGKATRKAASSSSAPFPSGTTQISVPLKPHLSFKSGRVGVKFGFPVGAE